MHVYYLVGNIFEMSNCQFAPNGYYLFLNETNLHEITACNSSRIFKVVSVRTALFFILIYSISIFKEKTPYLSTEHG